MKTNLITKREKSAKNKTKQNNGYLNFRYLHYAKEEYIMPTDWTE